MMEAQAQRAFLSMFAALLGADFLAQLVSSAGLAELQPLVALWYGPLDDLFYGVVGTQAAYYLCDPGGETRSGPAMTWTATVRAVGRLLSDPDWRLRWFPGLFFAGSRRSSQFLGIAVLLASVAALWSPSTPLQALQVMLQRHLTFLLPVMILLALALGVGLRVAAPSAWLLAVATGLGALLLSVALDGRWGHHTHHLLSACFELQAWGAAVTWIALGAATLQQPSEVAASA